MRASFTYLLIAILLACPAMCRAAEVACCPGHEADGCPDEPGRRAPAAPGDADAVSCICGGAALRADDSHARNAPPLPAGLPPESLTPSVRPVDLAPTRGALPSDPDDWLGTVRLHALLEVFRC